MLAIKEVLENSLKQKIGRFISDLNRVENPVISMGIYNEYIVTECYDFLSSGALIVAEEQEGRDIIQAYYALLKKKLVEKEIVSGLLQEAEVEVESVFCDIHSHKNKAIVVGLVSDAPWLKDNPPVSPGERELKIAMEVCNNLKKCLGRGPSRAKVDILGNYVIIRTEGILHKSDYGQQKTPEMVRVIKKRVIEHCEERILPVFEELGLPVQEHFFDIDYKTNTMVCVWVLPDIY